METLPKGQLRAMEPDDEDFIYRMENDVEVWDVGSNTVPFSHYSITNYIATSASDIYADRQLRLVIEAVDGTPVGLLDLFNFEPRHNRVEVGILIAKEMRGRGYGTAALRRMVVYCREHLSLHQVYACMSVDNQSSIRLFENVGFKKTACLKNWVRKGNKYGDAVLMQLFL